MALFLGRRNDPFQRLRILLFPDHVEEVSLTAFNLEVRRLFFDEATCATVHRKPGWPEQVLLGLLAILFVGLGIWALTDDIRSRWLEGGLLGMGALFVAWVVVLGFYPAYCLTIHTPDQAVRVTLTRRPGRRGELLRRFREAVETYQASHAPAVPESAPAAPAPLPPA